MLVLGLESSCDETAAAVVEEGWRVRSHVVKSQIARHAPFGGVIPEIAAREHLLAIDPLVHQALHEAKLSLDKIDAIAVTQGPGLIGALLVGVSYAKGLALRTGKPLIPVNHVHAHVHGALCDRDPQVQPTAYPCLALVVSGGHTHLYYMEDPVHFELMAHSIDDACGESFDKVAKILGFGYPGGPLIEACARQGNPQAVPMPKMIEEKARMAFSYSGLKTYMVNLIEREKVRAAKQGGERSLSEQWRADVAAAFQEEALGQILRKIRIAIAQRPRTASVLIAGGVAANRRFQELVARNITCPAVFPALTYCSDNAAMIAALGGHLFARQGAAAGSSSMEWDAFSRYPY